MYVRFEEEKKDYWQQKNKKNTLEFSYTISFFTSDEQKN